MRSTQNVIRKPQMSSGLESESAHETELAVPFKWRMRQIVKNLGLAKLLPWLSCPGLLDATVHLEGKPGGYVTSCPNQDPGTLQRH